MKTQWLNSAIFAMLALASCGRADIEKQVIGTYLLEDGYVDPDSVMAGQDNTWGTLQLHDGGRYSGEFRIGGDDDPPFEGGWFSDGDSIRFSGPLEHFVGHRSRKRLHLTEKLDTTFSVAEESVVYDGPDPRTPEQKRMDQEREARAAADAKAEMLARMEERRSRFTMRWTEP